MDIPGEHYGGCQLPYAEFEQNNLCKAHPKIFWEFPTFQSENPGKLWGIPKISGTAMIKSILITCHKLRQNRSGYNFMYVKC